MATTPDPDPAQAIDEAREPLCLICRASFRAPGSALCLACRDVDKDDEAEPAQHGHAA